MSRWSLQDSPGMLPALPGYNPVLDIDLPDGWTAEYYGDDVLYVGFEGKMAFEIWDQPNLHLMKVERIDTAVADYLFKEIKKIEDRYPIETFAGIHSQGI